MAHQGCCLFSYSLSFVSHDDNAMGREFLLIDVLSVEEGPIDGSRSLTEFFSQFAIVDADASESTHSGLCGLGIVDVGGVRRTEDVTNAKPIGQPNDGTQIARVLYTIECQSEFLFGYFCQMSFDLWNRE